MKTLIFADVHSNLAALEAMLAAEGDWDDLIFLGDAVLGGPQPEEVVQRLAELDGLFLMGNHDAEMLVKGPEQDSEDRPANWGPWTRSQLSDASRAFLSTFRKTCAIEHQGLTLRLHHGDFPPPVDDRLWPDDPEEFFLDLARRFPEPIILFAHCHIQFRRQVGSTTFINPGGLGQPRLSEPLACYAVLIDGRFDLRGVPYDVEQTCRAVDAAPLDPGFQAEWTSAFRAGEVPARYNIRDFTSLRGHGYR
jgi:predicted phosphodiesterase